MQVLLIYFSVMMLRYAMSSNVEDIDDLSNWCARGRVISYYLTSGAGFSDKSVAMVASERPINCTLVFKVKPDNYIMIVVELPDQMPFERVCYTKTNNTILVRDYNEKYNCQGDGKDCLYADMSQETVSVSISSKGGMNTVKITSTSMRDGRHQKCFTPDEITCIHNNKVFCMTSQTLCDGHNNCGVRFKFDESDEKCKELTMPFLMVIITLLMLILTFVLIGSVALSAIPSRKEIFIQAYTQSLMLFDCDDDIITSEIYIQELYPIEGSEEEN